MASRRGCREVFKIVKVAVRGLRGVIKARRFFLQREYPFHDQGVLSSVVVRNHAGDLKSHLKIKVLGSLIASSHLCPYFLRMRGFQRRLEKLGPNPFFSVLRMNGDRDDMSVFGEDDIS